jgi:deoxyribodipyrimidine photo-lyase
VTALLWLRRDLRVHDHPALFEAVRRHPAVVPAFVVDDTPRRSFRAARNRRWFLARSLLHLRDELERRGGTLEVRVGPPERVVPELADAHGATAVYVSREYGPYGRRRDGAVRTALSAIGVEWREKPGVLMQEPEDLRTAAGRAPRTFAAFHRRLQALPPRRVLAPPRRIPAPAEPSASGQRASEQAIARLEVEPTAELELLPEPGERVARARLARWCDGGLKSYGELRDLPGRRGTSGLSADLRGGLLSPAELLARVTDTSSDGAAEYARQLAWHDFYALQLFDDPSFATRSMRAAFEDAPWQDDPAAFAAWRDGVTGYPLVDAGMRQLRRSGWMHNRVRMVAASFLTKHLLIDWRLGARHFLDELVDGDLGSNAGGWQWAASSGPDAQPYFRIFNPVRQGTRFDPEGEYVRRWVPELSRVPSARIHEPWKMTPGEQREAGCRIGADYPAPIVDHATARARALEAFGAAARSARGDATPTRARGRN